MDNTVCGYCKKSKNELQRLNNADLLQMMKTHDRSYTRATQFCRRCRERMIAKFNRRKQNERIAQKKASTSGHGQTTYSNSSHSCKLHKIISHLQNNLHLAQCFS